MGTSGDLFSIGTSALVSYQRALTTASHNISNVENPYYSRQRVELSANTPTYAGYGYLGTGSGVSAIERLYSGFLTTSVIDHTAAYAEADTYLGYATQVEDLIADPDAGLGVALEGLFGALADLANDPASTTTRQVVLSEAENLADRFHAMGQSLTEIGEQLDGQLHSGVEEINALATQIAQLNGQIVAARGQAGGASPNDLLDQRDALLGALAEKVGVSSYEQDDGSVNVFIGSGQNLVVGSSARQLTLSGNSYDGSRLEVAFADTPDAPITDFLSGGELGGLLDFRDQVLEPTRDELGLMAVALAGAMNEIQGEGMDLNGELGAPLFYAMDGTRVSGPAFLPDTLGNAATTDLTASVAFGDLSALHASDYLIEYDGSDYTVTRLSDGEAVGSFAAGGLPQTLDLASEGLSVTLSGTSVSAGDSFLLKPVENGLADIRVALSDTDGLAAAAPLRVAEAADALGTPTNTGSGNVTFVALDQATGVTLQGAIGVSSFTLTYDAGSGQFAVSDPPASLAGFTVTRDGAVVAGLPYDPVNDSGSDYTLTVPGYGEVTLTLGGSPDTGDRFIVGDNDGGVGDGGNALRLAALQEEAVVQGEDLQGLLADTIAKVGIFTARAEQTTDAQAALLNSALDARDALSGVNLDEEAADLIRYQNAYQAAAQVFQVGREIFETLLQATSR